MKRTITLIFIIFVITALFLTVAWGAYHGLNVRNENISRLGKKASMFSEEFKAPLVENGVPTEETLKTIKRFFYEEGRLDGLVMKTGKNGIIHKHILTDNKTLDKSLEELTPIDNPEDIEYSKILFFSVKSTVRDISGEDIEIFYFFEDLTRTDIIFILQICLIVVMALFILTLAMIIVTTKLIKNNSTSPKKRSNNPENRNSSEEIVAPAGLDLEEDPELSEEEDNILSTLDSLDEMDDFDDTQDSFSNPDENGEKSLFDQIEDDDTDDDPVGSNSPDNGDEWDMDLPDLDPDLPTMENSTPEIPEETIPDLDDLDTEQDDMDTDLDDLNTDLDDLDTDLDDLDTDLDDLDTDLDNLDTDLDDLNTDLDDIESEPENELTEDTVDEEDEELSDFSSFDDEEDTGKSETAESLYSPRSGLGWESFLPERLEHELERAAEDNEELLLILLEDTKVRGDQDYGLFAERLKKAFPHTDLDFEYKEKGFAVLQKGTALDSGITQIEELMKTWFEEEQITSVRAGLSTRSGRLVDAERLLMEAENCLKKCNEENPIIAFRPDPDKYRDFINKKD